MKLLCRNGYESQLGYKSVLTTHYSNKHGIGIDIRCTEQSRTFQSKVSVIFQKGFHRIFVFFGQPTARRINQLTAMSNGLTRIVQ